MQWIKVYEKIDYNNLDANHRKTIDGLAGGYAVVDESVRYVRRVDAIRVDKSQYEIWILADEDASGRNTSGMVHLSSLAIKRERRDHRSASEIDDAYIWRDMVKYDSYTENDDVYTENVSIGQRGNVMFMLHNTTSGMVYYARKPSDLPRTLPDYYEVNDGH